jgi:septum formation protein
VLVLASRSPQRKQILDQLGVEFRVEPADADELTAGDPREVVVANALAKARTVAGRAGGEPVLGADTEVFLDGRIFGKAEDERQAESHLGALSGRTHEVWGGIALIEDGVERTACAVTRVRFRALERRELDWYLGTGEWRDRAGAYAIQGRGSALVESVEGDFWNVVGLPVAELRRLAPHLVTS